MEITDELKTGIKHRFNVMFGGLALMALSLFAGLGIPFFTFTILTSAYIIFFSNIKGKLNTIAEFFKARATARVFYISGPEDAAKLEMSEDLNYRYFSLKGSLSYTSLRLPPETKDGTNEWKIVSSKKTFAVTSNSYFNQDGPKYPFLAFVWDKKEECNLYDKEAEQLFYQAKD